jgi:hypothetical protein
MPKKTKFTPRRVEVLWEDAWHEGQSTGMHQHDWTDDAKHYMPALVSTVGWLVMNTAKAVCVAKELMDYEDMNYAQSRQRQFIPKGMIRKIRYLK